MKFAYIYSYMYGYVLFNIKLVYRICKQGRLSYLENKNLITLPLTWVEHRSAVVGIKFSLVQK